MRRLGLLLVAALVLVLPGEAQAAKAKRKVEVVCFKQTKRTADGRRVRRTVCRPRRTVKRAPSTAPVAPGPVAAPPTAPEAPQPQAVPVATPSAPPAPPAPSEPATPKPVVCEDDSVWMTAIAEDLGTHFSLRLSRPCLRAGKLVVVLENRDAQEHDLRAVGLSPARPSRELVPATDPESSQQRTTALEEGSWRLYCSLPGHASMTRDLTVTPAS